LGFPNQLVGRKLKVCHIIWFAIQDYFSKVWEGRKRGVAKAHEKNDVLLHELDKQSCFKGLMHYLELRSY
jgi:hypothetical protein